jgi:hypothetical protein
MVTRIKPSLASADEALEKLKDRVSQGISGVSEIENAKLPDHVKGRS